MKRLSRPLSPEIRIALLLFGLAALLRLALLDSNPPGLFRDEAEKVYSAWSLARTGGYHHVAMGMSEQFAPVPVFAQSGPPLFVDAYGSWTSAIYHWACAPFALLLGPTPLAARLPAAIAGLLAIGAAWRFTRRAHDAEVAILALFFLAVSPWHVLFSRWAQQGIFVPMWLALGLLLFERGRLSAGRPWWLAGVCFGLALYSYAPMRLTVPLFVLALGFAHRDDIVRHRRAALLALLAFALTVLPTALWLALHREEGMTRFSRVAIWSGDDSSAEVVTEFFSNYLKHLSIPFLFVSGDANLRHSLPGFGQMNWIELPGLLVALTVAIIGRRPQDLTLALWFLLAPVAPSLTRDSPHALRDLAALPAAHVLSAFGTAEIFRGAVRWAHMTLPRRRRRWERAQEWIRVNVDGLRATGLILGGATALFLTLQLFVRYPAVSARAWETGLHEAVREAAAVTDGGTVLVVSDDGALLGYLPSHLRVALRVDPSTLRRNEALLPEGWSSPLTRSTDAPSVVVAPPGAVNAGPPVATVTSPGNRFAPRPAVLWHVYARPEQSALESPPALP